MMEPVPAMYLQNVQHMLPPQPQAPPAASDACLTIVHSLMCHRQVMQLTVNCVYTYLLALNTFNSTI